MGILNRRVASAAGLAGVLAACSSVPDVTFSDVTTTAGDAGLDGRADATTSPDSSAPPCGGRSGNGICCPNGVWCQNCSPSECAQCPVCATDLVCCRNRGGQMACMSGSNC